MDRVRVLCCVLVCLCFVGRVSIAQTITGTLTGTVEDPAEGVVPGVKVTVTSVSTGVSHSTITNAAGVYNLPFLAVGQYNISAEAPNFKKSLIGPITLEVNMTARVDIRMELGAMTDSVEVTGIAPILQTETTQTGDTISKLQATRLPLNGRNFVSLTLLVPGSITPNPSSFTQPSRSFGGGRPYVNGNREQTNNFLLDGLEINETIDNLIGYNPNVDALEEMKVMTGNASSEFGNSNGAIVNMTLKSGTNSFHGNAFEFLRNDVLDANGFFNNRSGAAKQALRQNIFGGTIGGPILKNRLFFFADYQGTRQRISGPNLATVLPASFRTGNLSLFPTPITDPVTGNPFPGNIIPEDRIVNPSAKALFANPTLYPLPNNPGTGTIGITNNYLGSNANGLDNDQGDAKIDYQPTDKDTLSGRMTLADFRSSTTKVTLPTFLGGATSAPTKSFVVTWTRTISPAIVNEARVGYTRIVILNITTDPAGVLGPNGNATLGIPGGQPISGASAIAIGEGISNVGAAATDSSTWDNTFSYADNLTWVLNRHTLKMGFNALRYQQNRFYAGNNGLLGNFDYGSARYSGNGVADFLLNDLSAKGRGSLTGDWGHRQWRPGLFMQDDFKVTKDVTLNLGLRWEFTQPVYEVLNRQANVDLQTGEQILPVGHKRALYNAYWLQLMPRLGVAWSPGALNQKFVLRAGYGLTSYMEGTGANLRLTLNPPFFFESQVTYSLTNPGKIQTGFSDVIPQNVLAGQVRAWNPDLRPAMIQQGNLSAEYQFTENLSVTAAYVGQRGHHLVNPREYNQPLADPGPVDTWRPLQERRRLFSTAPLITNISGTDSSANMSYNSLQLTGRNRFSHGIEFLAAYTYGKGLTDNLGYYGSAGVASEGAYWQNAYNRRADWGRSFFDSTHIFSLGGTYELPFGNTRTYGKSWKRPMNYAFGDWNVDYVLSLHSGFPVTITGNDQSNQAVRGATRPNAYHSLTYQNQTVDNWFGTGNSFCLTPGVNDGTCAYGLQQVGTFGNAGVGTERAPDFKNFDFVVAKQFHTTESQYITFRAEFYNLFNLVSFGPPERNISSPSTFGSITSTITSPRNIQFALKYNF